MRRVSVIRPRSLDVDDVDLNEVAPASGPTRLRGIPLRGATAVSIERRKKGFDLEGTISRPMMRSAPRVNLPLPPARFISYFLVDETALPERRDGGRKGKRSRRKCACARGVLRAEAPCHEPRARFIASHGQRNWIGSRVTPSILDDRSFARHRRSLADSPRSSLPRPETNARRRDTRV